MGLHSLDTGFHERNVRVDLGEEVCGVRFGTVVEATGGGRRAAGLWAAARRGVACVGTSAKGDECCQNFLCFGGNFSESFHKREKGKEGMKEERKGEETMQGRKEEGKESR